MSLKRAFDLSAATIALILLLPLLGLLCLVVRITMGSPVIFRQRRPGLHGNTFTLYKFRTMANTATETVDPRLDANRMTSFGKFLRKSSLDELPELINVLRGEMSLVGPRPLLVEYLDLYTQEQQRRHEVRPGITGWAQINGRNALSWEEKFALDVWYVDHRSFALDLKILLLTMAKVLRSEGVNQTENMTTEKFHGSGK